MYTLTPTTQQACHLVSTWNCGWYCVDTWDTRLPRTFHVVNYPLHPRWKNDVESTLFPRIIVNVPFPTWFPHGNIHRFLPSSPCCVSPPSINDLNPRWFHVEMSTARGFNVDLDYWFHVESRRVIHVEMSTWNPLSPVTKYPLIFHVEGWRGFHVDLTWYCLLSRFIWCLGSRPPNQITLLYPVRPKIKDTHDYSRV